MEIRVRFDGGEVLAKLRAFGAGMSTAIEAGVSGAAKTLLQDCRPYVPMLTGRLRDSGRVQQLENYAFRVIWDAANPRSGYVYAQRQYKEVLRHVDGKYAAQWIDRVLRENPGRYVNIAARIAQAEMERLLR